MQQLNPDSTLFNETEATYLYGTLNLNALTRAISEIVRRHTVLQTTFPNISGQPWQQIDPTFYQALALPVVDLQSVPPDQRRAAVQAYARAATHQRFDLATAAPWRITLLRLADSEHVVLHTFHHIIMDRWSRAVFSHEFSLLYAAFAAGRPTPLSDLPLQYADFAIWQQTWLHSADCAAQRAYWQQQLAGSAPLLDLPTDQPRPAIQTSRGRQQILALPPALLDALPAFHQQEGVTLFMTLLAAFAVLLARYTEQRDVVIGAPIAGRTHPDLERLLGCFINTLVLRIDLTGVDTARELLQRVRSVTLGAYAHQELPFEELVQFLQPVRTLRHSPLFQVALILQNVPESTVELPDLTIQSVTLEQETSQFDLCLIFSEDHKTLRGVIEYNPDLFDAVTITRLGAHFQTLLAGMIADPTCRLTDLPLLTPDEHQQLITAWNATAAPMPQRCIHQLIAAQAEQDPSRVAVICGAQRLTYGELNARANQLAHYLQRQGVGPEVRVGLCVERSVELVIGMLGVLKAGGAYVPLDPAYPRQRLAFMLADAQIQILVTQAPLAAQLPHGRVVCLDTAWPIIARSSPAEPPSTASPAHLAYVIYTSGSTGQPKGVMISHGALLNCMLSMRERPGLTPHDRFLAATTIAFDIAALEIYLPLLIGASVVLVSRAIASDGEQLRAYLSAADVTAMQATPTAWQLLLAAGWQGNPRLTILCGGEALPADLAAQLRARCAALWNMYGPTETTIWSTMHNVGSGDDPVPIGQPIGNTRIYILDPQMQLVPIGVAGELYIGGAGLARGYLGQPALSAAKFLPDPFSAGPSGQPGARLYRTGDKARLRADGQIEYLGRLDQQVKVRGFRIELGEIEAVLRRHADVREAVVLVREDTPGDKRLVAYVVENKEQTNTEQTHHHEHQNSGSLFSVLSSSELRQSLKQHLPDYMVPSVFVFLDALPQMPNGKLDRRALPMPDEQRSAGMTAGPAARDLLEQQLVQVWEKTLCKQPITITDNFFDLGGHSLLAAHLIARINDCFGRELPLSTIFQAPTVEQLAQILRQQPGTQLPPALIQIQAGGTQLPFFCVHPIDGNVFCYTELARQLGAEQPFYALEAVGINDDRAPHVDLKQMAANYIKAIQVIQPAGPYILGGWSFGGVIAFEMARQLQSQGQSIALLALFDSRPPASIKPRAPQRRAALLYSFVVALLGILWRHTYTLYNQIWQVTPRTKLRLILEFIHRSIRLLSHTTIVQVRRHFKVYKANILALSSYEPSPAAIRTALFHTNYPIAAHNPDDLIARWKTLCCGLVDSYPVPGKHAVMLARPHVAFLADQLRSCLRAAQPPDPAAGSGLHRDQSASPVAAQVDESARQLQITKGETIEALS